MSSIEVILITGMPGSGKTTISSFMEKNGFEIITMGDVIRELAKARGIEPTPSNLGQLAERIRKRKGKAAVAEECIRIMDKINKRKIAVDGTRSLEEVKTFKEHFKTRLVAVHSRPQTRYKRLKQRNRKDDPDDWIEFVERDRRELDFGIGSIIALADYMLVNEEGIPTLRKKFENMLRNLK